MIDIFISYAHSTGAQAQQIASALRELGYEVWLDDALPAHRPYTEVIEERLAAAKAVIVIWSADAVRSEWVQSEADRARSEHKLVQLTLDGVRLPMPFDRIQCADLGGWTGDTSAPAWRKIVESLAVLTGPASDKPVQLPNPAPLALPSKPSIAVLPFANLSNDPDQEYFVDGMVEEIVGALSCFKSIFVIAAGSSLTFKGKAISHQEAARQLGVRYLLEGSVRRAGGRIRVAVHLIEASDGVQIWTERFDDTVEDIFALQDRVAMRVAGVVDTTIEDLSIERAAARMTDNPNSYDFYLRSLPHFWTFQKEGVEQAIELIDRALALDADFGMALAHGSVCLRLMIDNGWAKDPDAYRKLGLERVERALRVAGSDSRVLAQAAASLPGLEGSLDRSLVLIERAISMNPGSSFVWLISGVLRIRAGAPELAAEHLENSMRLDPISTMNAVARMYLAMARFQQSRFEDALAIYQSTSHRLPASHAVLAAIYGHLREPTLAQTALTQFESLASTTLENVAEIWFRRPDHHKLFVDGVALARGEALAGA